MPRKSGETPVATKKAAKRSMKKALGGTSKKRKPMSGSNITKARGGKK